MSAALSRILILERIETDRFRGRNLDLGFPHIYGGQVLAQALLAARATVPGARAIHSLHAYFLRRGDHTRPIDYVVERTRDGNSFATRRVMAWQGDIPIYAMCASFQAPEDGLEFAEPPRAAMPDVPADEASVKASVPENVPPGIWETLANTFEVHAAEASDPLAGLHRLVWFRLAAQARGERQLDHPYLAYLSDYGLLTSALLPHGLVEDHAQMRIASIDHALWLHRPLNLDDWTLFDCGPVSNSNARSLTRGSFYDRHGRLLATVMQEGLVRLLPR
jgi:acyl-CoA thioesterase-2